MTVLSEYSMECRYAVRIRAGSTPGWSSVEGRPRNTEPSPMSFQVLRCGSGAHGEWLESRSISAITGRWPGARSVRWKKDIVYWSGIEEKLNVGPRYPRFCTV